MNTIMLVLWIIGIIAFIFAVKIFILIIQRLNLYRKISAVCIANSYKFNVKHWIISIFSKSFGADFEIETPSKTYAVYVYTTIFRRFRYHMTQDSVEIIRGRKAMYIVNKRVPAATANQDFITSVMKLKNFDFSKENNSNSCEKILLVHPLPHEVTYTTANQAVYMHDGDPLWDSVNYYSEKGFQSLLKSE